MVLSERGIIPLPEKVIKESDKLVSSNFAYTRESMIRDVLKGVDMLDAKGERYNRYPKPGLRLSTRQLRNIIGAGTLQDFLIGTPTKRPSFFVDHPLRYKNGTLHPDAQDVSNLSSQNKILLHPYFKEMITQSKLGVITGPGYYYKLGPNETADPVIIQLTAEGKAQFLCVQGTDGREWVLPGGDKDKGEDSSTTAAREAGEEAKIKNLQQYPHAVVARNIPVGDWRATVHAWPVSDIVLYVVDNRNGKIATNVGVGDSREIKKVAWKDLTEDNIKQLSFSHPNFVRLAVRKLEDTWGVVIDKKAEVGKAA